MSDLPLLPVSDLGDKLVIYYAQTTDSFETIVRVDDFTLVSNFGSPQFLAFVGAKKLFDETIGAAFEWSVGRLLDSATTPPSTAPDAGAPSISTAPDAGIPSTTSGAQNITTTTVIVLAGIGTNGVIPSLSVTTPGGVAITITPQPGAAAPADAGAPSSTQPTSVSILDAGQPTTTQPPSDTPPDAGQPTTTQPPSVSPPDEETPDVPLITLDYPIDDDLNIAPTDPAVPTSVSAEFINIMNTINAMTFSDAEAATAYRESLMNQAGIEVQVSPVGSIQVLDRNHTDPAGIAARLRNQGVTDNVFIAQVVNECNVALANLEQFVQQMQADLTNLVETNEMEGISARIAEFIAGAKIDIGSLGVRTNSGLIIQPHVTVYDVGNETETDLSAGFSFDSLIIPRPFISVFAESSWMLEA